MTLPKLLSLLVSALCVAGQAFIASAAVTMNDDFASRSILSGTTNSASADSTLATGEMGEPNHLGHTPSASLWWSWTSPDNGRVIVTTFGSTFDTLLSVYTGASLSTLTLVAENDDGPGEGTSIVSFEAVRGTTYQIAVDGYAGASGIVMLNLRLPITPTAPKFTSQPGNRIVPISVPTNITFGVTVEGSFQILFQWELNGKPIIGATNDHYTIENVTLADAGQYRVSAQNIYGKVTSEAAVLTILQPASNDSFALRTTVSDPIQTISAYNLAATTEAGEPLHANTTSGASLWWTWTAPQNGLVRFQTSGSVDFKGNILDTVLAVYTGTELKELTPVVSNNDERPGTGGASFVSFRAKAGVAYQIAVAGVLLTNGTAAVGNVILSKSQELDNDSFSNALTYPSSLNVARDDLSGTTQEPGEPDHAKASAGNSTWWTWIAPVSGDYILDTKGSLIDTVLAVYTGTNLQDLVTVGEDDNRGEANTSLVKFRAEKGQRYFFAVDRFAGAPNSSSGQIFLNLNQSSDSNDNFADRYTLAGQFANRNGSNRAATVEAGEPDHSAKSGGHSLWWTWTAPITAPVIITTRNSSFDTILSVYKGQQLKALSLVVENDDAPLPTGVVTSAVHFHGVEGQTYQIVVDGHRLSDGRVASGDVELSIVQPNLQELGGNDMFEDRFTISGQSNVIAGVNSKASKEPGEPAHGGNDGGRSLWWSWVAPASGPVRLLTLGSNIDTLLAIYLGNTVDSLELVAGDERSGGFGRSSVVFHATIGTEYQIAVDGFNDGEQADGGYIELHLFQYPEGELLANDSFDHASSVSDHFLTLHGLNIGATREENEPAHNGTTEGRSVWWKWMALLNSEVTITTTNSSFDTLLAVYTGENIDELSLVIENDDIDPGTVQSKVTFQAMAGVIYHIAVDGYENQMGLITLSIHPQAETAAPPQITQSPFNQTRFAGAAGGGSNVTFRVVATGTMPLEFQWRHNGIDLIDATNSVLTLLNATSEDAGQYEVTVTNSFGAITSQTAVFTWIDLPFNDSFAHRLGFPGSSTQMFGSILGASKETYEKDHGESVGGRSVWWTWRAPKSGVVEINTEGSSCDTLLAVYQGTNLENLQVVSQNNDLILDTVYLSRVVFNAIANQEYHIAVDNPKTNSNSGSIRLNVNMEPKPWIILQPDADISVNVTNTFFKLQVKAAAVPPVEYRWFLNGSPIPEATNSFLTFESLGRNKSGVYSISVKNDFGSVVSSNANVWVQVPQILQAPALSKDGKWFVSFADTDGSTSLNPERFQIQHTSSFNESEVIWVSESSPVIIQEDGKLSFQIEMSENQPQVFYRVLER